MSNLLKLIVRNDHLLKDLRKLSSSQHLRGYNLLNNFRQDNVISQKVNYSTRLSSNKLNNNQNKLLDLNEIKCYEYKTIKTTKVNQALPPIIWLVVRPVLNVAAALGGRRVRVWWRQLPEERKQYYRNKARKNKRFIYSLLGGLFVLSSIYYGTHIEETAITKRKRFVAISKEKYEELSKIQFELQLKMFEEKLLPVTHPMSKAVERVATKLIKANLDIPEFREKNWTTAVVYDKNVKNAMVVGDGKIFVFSAMFDMCENDHSLAFILAHEIAHSILSHGREILSYSEFINIFVTLGLFLIWSVFPTDLSAGFAHIITNKIVNILFHLPYGRAMEIEADRVGLLFAAKACFDVREGVAFWRKMAYLDQNKMEQTVGDKDFANAVEFLSTHPTHEKRAEILESMLEESLELRTKLSCPRLPYHNPIELLERKIAFEKKLNEKPLNYAVIRAN